MKKVKIVKCSKSSFWYNERIGEIFDVLSESNFFDGENYKVIDPNDGVYSYILVSDTEEVGDRKEPRIYEKDGKKYLLPEWAKYVTSHNGSVEELTAWEFKPEYRGKYNTSLSDAGWWRAKSDAAGGKGKIEVLKEYAAPLPEGVFIEDVSNI